jgi:hypothetical protein
MRRRVVERDLARRAQLFRTRDRAEETGGTATDDYDAKRISHSRTLPHAARESKRILDSA